MPLSDAAIQHYLQTWPVARLATLNPDGTPHQIPLVFAWHDGLLWSPVDGKPKTGRQLARVRNILAEPRGSLLLDHYAADWTQLWWLRVEVKLSVLSVDTASADQGQQAEGAVQALRAKYPQYQTTPVLRDPPTLIAMRPLALHSWVARG